MKFLLVKNFSKVVSFAHSLSGGSMAMHRIGHEKRTGFRLLVNQCANENHHIQQNAIDPKDKAETYGMARRRAAMCMASPPKIHLNDCIMAAFKFPM